MAASTRPPVREPEIIAAPPISVASVTVDADRFLDAFLWLLALDNDAEDTASAEVAA